MPKKGFDFEPLREAFQSFGRRAGNGVSDRQRRDRDNNDENHGALTDKDRELGSGVDRTPTSASPSALTPSVEPVDLPDGATTWSTQFGDSTTQIGANANQVHHAFRHTAESGLANEAVARSVLHHFTTSGPGALAVGERYVGDVVLDGIGVQYTAFGIDVDVVNIGRIIVP